MWSQVGICLSSLNVTKYHGAIDWWTRCSEEVYYVAFIKHDIFRDQAFVTPLDKKTPIPFDKVWYPKSAHVSSRFWWQLGLRGVDVKNACITNDFQTSRTFPHEVCDQSDWTLYALVEEMLLK